MKNKILYLGLCFGMGLMLSFTMRNDKDSTTSDIQWYSLEEAMAAQKKNPKKILVDVYTNWCSWCKMMDKKTLADPSISSYINQHFYPVKLNAEQKEDINFNGKVYQWEQKGKNGSHALATLLLDGKMSYPSFVCLDEKLEPIFVSPGFKKPAQLLPELKFATEGHYQKMTWEEYLQKGN